MLVLSKNKEDDLSQIEREIAGFAVGEAMDESPLIDFCTLSQLQNDLPDGMLPGMVDVFIYESNKRIEIISDLLSAGDIPEIAKQAHALKGSAATFGASLLTMAAVELDIHCKQGNNAEVNMLAKQVIRVGQQTISAFRNYFEE
jgi:HPt (histidine-containing phosphotransfer) domain-containing protein